MARKATVVKVKINVANMDVHHYQDHEFTIAMHPSENERRVMVRLIAYCFNAHLNVSLTKGLCADDEPELWAKDDAGVITHWIDLGQLDEKWLRKASSKAQHASLYCYGGGAVAPWWQQIATKLSRFDNLSVWEIDEQQASDAQSLFSRNMQLSASIDQNSLCLSNQEHSVWVTPTRLK
ncbi:YaeQ family protein [Paraferrimonas haliotis]|uniref:YaeQ protein n=1 Tax=Paraferrimonas haliotis TaxID=2013866 RepID=A0AA37TWJ3_9GAMM|nr:YaeQ family protein [Paraferrimonas haliotis]GLS82931.1 hypothetical protein GCM10007894_09080 [Paraferrimonas haliotis]